MTSVSDDWIELRHCFFFQAEDGIRDGHVTGVQTCALPISLMNRVGPPRQRGRAAQHSEISDFVPASDEVRDALAAQIGRASCRERVGRSVVAGGLKKKRG